MYDRGLCPRSYMCFRQKNTMSEPISNLAKYNMDVSSLRDKAKTVRDASNLTALRDSLEDLHTKVSGLPQRVRDVRAKGYAFDRALDSRAQDLPARWNDGLRAQVMQQIDNETQTLRYDLPQLDFALANVQDEGAVASAQQTLAALGDKAEAANRRVKGMFDAFDDEVAKTAANLSRIERAQAKLGEASFVLRPTEVLLAAVQAKWDRENTADPNGVLFLTDLRVLFEQREEVATKKVLFITTEKKMVRKLMLDVPLPWLTRVESSSKGLFGNEDHLDLHFQTPAPLRQAHMHLDGQESDEWKVQIERAQKGAYEGDRALPIDQVWLDKLAAAPRNCPKCGGEVRQLVQRGIDRVDCEYCGSEIAW